MDELEYKPTYEKAIGLKTIWLTLVRRWKLILTIFVPIGLVVVIATQLVMARSYQSGITITRAAFDQNAYVGIQNSIRNTDVTNQAAESLKTKNIKYKNGGEITTGDIYGGLSFSTITGSVTSFTVYFNSKDKTVVSSVIKEVVDIAYATIGGTNKSEPSAAKLGSKNNTYLLVGLAVDAVLALGFPFAYEIVSDEVYDKDDAERLGGNGFEITVLQKKK